MSFFKIFSRLNYKSQCIYFSRKKVMVYIPVSFIHKISKIFPPIKDFSGSGSGPGSTLSMSHRLMLNYGIISAQDNGLSTLLPLGFRSIEKLSNILVNQMQKLNCEKLSLPTLISTALWEKSGRLQSSGSEVMKMIDRHKQKFILGPTHEESMAKLVSNMKNLSYSHLPIRLYQISSKFRDEMRLKHGLLRDREFLMKDLYTFDENILKGEETYNSVMKIYMEIFKILGIPIIKAEASVGSIGGIKSHEFHVPVGIGEDTLMNCESCEYSINDEILSESSRKLCSNCGKPLTSIKGIEVAHAFLLGTKYTSPLSANYMDSDGKQQSLEMGCYGIGVTRLLAAGIESLSRKDNLVWPNNIAPFKVCLIPPKRGSKEAQNSHWCSYLYDVINNIDGYYEDIIIDDRTKLSIGKRLQDAEKFGYPIIIVIGKHTFKNIPLFEVFNNKNNVKLVINQLELIDYLKQYK